MSQDGTAAEIERLLARLRDGDAAARDALFRCAWDRLERLARKMLGGFPVVKGGGYQTGDVLDPAAQRLHQALQTMTSPPATALDLFRLAAWLIRRELIDLARRLRKRPPPSPWKGPGSDRDGSPGGADPPEGTDRDPSRLAMWTEFHQAVDRLPGPLREAFDLLWYQGLTQAEAAVMLGVCTKTVRRRWVEARVRLCDELGGRLPGPAGTGRSHHV
jgi:RNA polymerase sigma-70 factor (ECF subfamily)